MHPRHARLLMLPSLPLKISDCTKTEFVWRESEGGEAYTCGWRKKRKKKSGSDVGLIMLIPTSLYGNTSSTPSPHNLTSSCLKQKLATTTDSFYARGREREADRETFSDKKKKKRERKMEICTSGLFIKLYTCIKPLCPA